MRMFKIFAVAFFAFVTGSAAQAGEPVNVYGPGGPLPAMKEAAVTFSAEHHIDVRVMAGPTPKWLAQAKQDGDIIFSGSEVMMSGFLNAMPAQIDPKTVTPLYMRPATILVRPGNPTHISGLHDLLMPGRRILVVNGAGQQGLWEDVAGRLGNLKSLSAFRANIVKSAANSAEAKKAWTDDTSIDAWLIWNIWQVANPSLADQVAIEPEYRIWRDTGVVLTHRGEEHEDAKQFVTFLKSSQGAAIFAKWGWTAPDR